MLLFDTFTYKAQCSCLHFTSKNCGSYSRWCVPRCIHPIWAEDKLQHPHCRHTKEKCNWLMFFALLFGGWKSDCWGLGLTLLGRLGGDSEFWLDVYGIACRELPEKGNEPWRIDKPSVHLCFPRDPAYSPQNALSPWKVSVCECLASQITNM